ncbi:MAG: histidine kinase [Ignavibacteria bacterium]|nr:histidine kinase [Ignavibacteria bacterium]
MFTILAVIVCVKASGQSFVHTRQLDMRDGLSHNIVLCVLRDSRGFMWFGTRDGLDRYDGYTFRHSRSKPFNENSLPNNVVLSLVEDPWGLIWIGTDGGGLCAYDRTQDTYTHFHHDPANTQSLGGGTVSTLVIDSARTLWIGTVGGGLSRLDLCAYHNPSLPARERARFSTVTTRGADGKRLSSDEVLGLYVNSDASIWATLSTGNFDRIDLRSGAVRTYWHTPPFGYRSDAPPVIRSRGVRFSFLPMASHGFIFSDREKIFEYRSSDDRIHDVGALRGSRADGNRVVIGANGRMLTVLDTRGLRVIDADNGRASPIAAHITNAESFRTSDGFRVIAVGKDQAWLANGSYGVIAFDFSESPFRQCLPDPVSASFESRSAVRALGEDAQGNILAGLVHRGLGVLDRQHSSTFHMVKPDILPLHAPVDLVINDVFTKRDSEILLATRSCVLERRRGVAKYRKVAFESKRDPSSPPDLVTKVNLFTVCVDHQGAVWTGGVRARHGILMRRDTQGTVVSFSDDRVSSSRSFGSGVWTLLEDRDGVMWVGAQNGLHAYDPRNASWKHYQFDPADTAGLICNEIWTLHDDGQHTLWIGTLGGGLDAFDKRNGRFRHVTTKEGLASDLILGVLADARGRLWLSTGAGISRYDPRTREVMNFRGGAIEAVLPFSFGSALRASNGTCFFGGNSGALAFHPDSVDAPRTPANIVITGVNIPGVPVARDIFDGDLLEVPNTAYFLTVDFSSLDFRNPSGMRYAWRIEERDTAWIPLGTQHQLTLSDLSPGLHTLRVKGANSEGVWNERGVMLRIRVIPPWHMTWWFRALAGLLLLSVVVGGGVQRARVMHSRERTRRRLIESELKALRAQMNPHFLFNCLGAVQSAMLGNDIERANDLLAKIARLTRMVLEHSAQKVVPLEDELTLLRLYCEMEALRHGDRFSWSVDADPALPPDLPIPSMLIQPYVENAIQHGLRPLTRRGLLRIALTPSEDGVQCVIEDNGIGRAAAMEQQQQRSEKHRSMGMELTRERLEILNEYRSRRMHLTVTDLLDADGLSAGTRITIVIPSDTD